ncbi:MAG: hypothetical protein AAFV85_09960 [Cyanobacteria bacterium J06634_6]
MSDAALAAQLESYTLKHPQEVLIVHAQIAGEPDQIVVFRGFSSSLMRPTAFDPEVPVLSNSAVISHIDRLQGPYIPDAPVYIEQNISLEQFISEFIEPA